MALNNVLDQMDLSYIYRTFHPKEAKCTFFSNAYGTFTKIDHMVGHKINFKIKDIKRDTEGHFIIPKGRIHQEDINIINIYAPNIGAPKYIRKS